MSRLPKVASVLGVLMATVMIAFVAGSCSDGGTSHKTARTADATTTTTGPERGAAVYAATCAGCHGSDGGGGIGPQLSGGHAVARFPSADDQVAFVTGTHAPLVPAVGQLSSDDVRAVVEYTRGL
jgi:mono/diheme cytochrome c family protein